MTAASTNPNYQFVTEHTVELSYISRLLGFMMTGQVPLVGGGHYHSHLPLVDETILDNHSIFHQDDSVWEIPNP